MHFDDRLATVLRHRAAGETAARTQFRQLLDLLGARHEGRDESLRAAGWLRLGALGELIPARERAAMIAERGWRFNNPSLVAHLAEDEPEVAAAALARAELAGPQWVALIPTLPIRARGFLRLRSGLPEEALRILDQLGVSDRGLPSPIVEMPDADKSSLQPVPEEEPFELTVEEDRDERVGSVPRSGEIGELVARIEAFQRARSAAPASSDPRLPLGEPRPEPSRAPLLGFSFATNAAGRIEWAEPGIAPMVVGIDLFGNDPELLYCFEARQPIRNAAIELEGAPAISGDWVLDAAPRFTRPAGRYYGYAGKLRRPARLDRQVATTHQQQEADRIRQLLHELRTPVNAIQGFAEVIQQQLFGATPHEYRALAASIASDAAHMLAGFDELDRLARLEAGFIRVAEGESDFGAIVRRQLDQLQGVLRARVAGFEARLSDLPCNSPIAGPDAEQLAWRMLATLAALVRGGERLGLELTCDADELALACELPAALVPSSDVFASAVAGERGPVSAGMFGSGFALRLARAEARSTGGNLARIKDHLVLTLPLRASSGTGSGRAGEPQDTPRRRVGG